MLKRLALHRPELRAWALYDWANSAFVTTVVAAVYPTYFRRVAAAPLDDATATSRFALTSMVALAVAAVLGPVLGAIADRAPLKKRLLGAFVVLGAGCSAGLFFVERGDWRLGLVLFGLGNVAGSVSFVFYDALLPHIASRDEIDRVSTAGYALGYLGGGLLLALNLAWILWPGAFGLPEGDLPARLAFVSVGIWWLVFSIPLFRRVPEPRLRAMPVAGVGLVRGSFAGLWRTLRELSGYRQATLMMVAFLLYNDGIQTIIRMAAIYAAGVGIDEGALIGAILLVQLIGVPCAFLFGQLADRIGARPAIVAGLVVYAAVSILAWRMQTAAHFFALAILVGVVQGGCQALSRSLFASMIPKRKSAEFFGLFAVLEKFAGIFGPGLFALAVAITGSNRSAILSVILFFLVGGGLLLRVDVEAGRRAVGEG